jgi:hypothetical protein
VIAIGISTVVFAAAYGCRRHFRRVLLAFQPASVFCLVGIAVSLGFIGAVLDIKSYSTSFRLLEETAEFCAALTLLFASISLWRSNGRDAPTNPPV